MSGVFLHVEIDKNEPHVFAFDPQLQNAHLSGSCLSSHSAPPTSMPVKSTTPDTPTASKITFPTAAGFLQGLGQDGDHRPEAGVLWCACDFVVSKKGLMIERIPSDVNF